MAGLGVLAHTVIRFAVEGLGTPFPAAPTENLVVGGLYRYVRNPMYLAVIAMHPRPGGDPRQRKPACLRRDLLGHRRELRPLLRGADAVGKYGEQYAAYRRAVRGWWPRATPWRVATAATRTEASATTTSGASR